MKEQQEPCCKIHPETKLICPLCRAAEIGKAGGMATAKKYGSVQLSRWGAKGGRPKKKKPGTRKKS